MCACVDLYHVDVFMKKYTSICIYLCISLYVYFQYLLIKFFASGAWWTVPFILLVALENSISSGCHDTCSYPVLPPVFLLTNSVKSGVDWWYGQHVGNLPLLDDDWELPTTCSGNWCQWLRARRTLAGHLAASCVFSFTLTIKNYVHVCIVFRALFCSQIFYWFVSACMSI